MSRCARQKEAWSPPWANLWPSRASAWVTAHRTLARRGALHRRLGLPVYGVLNRRLLAPLQERSCLLA
jgi:hypothetical protein